MTRNQAMSIGKGLPVTGLLVASFVLVAHAAGPNQINYQGFLRDAGGPVNGTFEMTFEIFSEATGGSPLWTETHRGVHEVEVVDGVFNVALGSRGGPSLDESIFDGTERWLQITVGDDPPLVPRRQFLNLPYAMRATVADVALSGGGSEGWIIDGDDMYSAVPGNVGIGTSSPAYKLDVEGAIRLSNDGHAVGLLGHRVDIGVDRGGYLRLSGESTTNNPLIELVPDATNYITAITPRISLYSAPDDGGTIDLRRDDGYIGVRLEGQETSSDGGQLRLFDHAGAEMVEIDSEQGVGGGSRINLRNGNGVITVSLDAQDAGGAGRLTIDGEGDSGGALYGVDVETRNHGSGNAIAVYGYGIADGVGTAYGGRFLASGLASGTHYGVYGYEQAGGNGAAVYASGDYAGSGGKYAVVRTSRGRRLLSVMESPGVWFEDFGESRLVNGRVHIDLDPLFLETVTIDDAHPMKVFVQLEDDCSGVFVRKSSTGFDVIELQGGLSNAAFSYRIVAKRKGYEDERLRETQVGADDPVLYPELQSVWETKSARHKQEAQEGTRFSN